MCTKGAYQPVRDRPDQRVKNRTTFPIEAIELNAGLVISSPFSRSVVSLNHDGGST